MTPAISIIIPHLRNADNDKALKIALDCIIDNTDIDYELIVEAVATRRDIYPVLNNMAHRARAEWLVFSNSDVFQAPGWASAMYAARDVDAIVTGIIAECGAISVAADNYELHYGVTPGTYNRAGFEAWVEQQGATIYSHKAHQHRGWYFPCLLNKRTFNHSGGFDSSVGAFPQAACDMAYWDAWAASGKSFRRVNSWCYHLQNFTSDEPERIANRQRMNGAQG
jgi:hypothetical protein